MIIISIHLKITRPLRPMQSPEQYACKYSDTKSDYFRQPLQVKMSGVESSGVTLALVDSSLLSCWEEMIKQGKECSLVLKHNKGKVTTTLQSTSCLPHPSLSASKKTRKKASKKKRLEGLLATTSAWWRKGDCHQAALCCSKLLQHHHLQHLIQARALAPMRSSSSVTSVNFPPNRSTV